MKDKLSCYIIDDTPKEKIMTLLSFARLEELLPPHNFARVHKSYLVAVDKIEHIERNRVKIADQLVPISDTYKESFSKLLRGQL